MNTKYQYLFDFSAIVRYTDQGHGKPVVLLHGYLETLDIWSEFAQELSRFCRVISVDHMGHGGTKNDADIFTVEFSAELVKSVLDHLKIEKAVIVGHSMGGYTMLALEDLFPNRVSAMVFFHSISWADTDEKKINRDREIELVKANKRSVLYGFNIPRSFADDNVNQFSEQVELARSIAAHTSDEGIIAALHGMKARKDRTFVVEETTKPILFIIGEKDNYIPKEKLLALASKAKDSTIAILDKSGHMGFIEEKEKSVDLISTFMKKL